MASQTRLPAATTLGACVPSTTLGARVANTILGARVATADAGSKATPGQPEDTCCCGRVPRQNNSRHVGGANRITPPLPLPQVPQAQHRCPGPAGPA